MTDQPLHNQQPNEPRSSPKSVERPPSAAHAVRLRLPATSANLGPAFDTAAVALSLHLEITARAAPDFSIDASGRNADICANIERNLLLHSYRRTLQAHQRPVTPLHLDVVNGIPIGMGCGSSAAVRLAGVALASVFGELAWSRERILEEASRLEGHPDNAVACWLGGFSLAAWDGERLQTSAIAPPAHWKALLVMPDQPLATTAARAVLPATYSREDVIANLQRVGLLAAAFAQGRGDLLHNAMVDRIHQPYRSEICPLLPLLTPLAGRGGILGAALSGAGPSVLLVVDGAEDPALLRQTVLDALKNSCKAEILLCDFDAAPAEFETRSQ